MNIAMVASECAPFFKTGGLADVIAALPKYLAKRGHSLSVFLPKHRSPFKHEENLQFVETTEVWVNWRKQCYRLFHYEKDHVHYYFIDSDYYFNREQLYGEFDDAERYVFFTHAFFSALDSLALNPDIIHCHDWQTGLIPAYLKAGVYTEIKTVFTIHNLKYQGIFPPSVFDELLHLDRFHFGGLELNGMINFLKAALVHADWITTVSPSYSNEIKQPYYGEGLHPFLIQRESNLSGIINGIDLDLFDPAKDPTLKKNYKNNPQLKAENKHHLQSELHLPNTKDQPLFVLISRLVENKGLPLLTHILDELLTTEKMQLVIMGTGDQEFEQTFKDITERHKHSSRFINQFNGEYAQKLYAASDFFLMPSRFEPCGLGQLIALRYESVPIVRETGGLKDTIHAYNEFTGEGNGFSFTNYNANDLLHTIRYSIHIYHKPHQWNTLLANVYKSTLSWDQSAKQYEQVFQTLLTNEEDTNVDDAYYSRTSIKRETPIIIR